MMQSFASIGTAPAMSGARTRNTMLDWFFYDVGGLTAEERAHLVSGRNVEGTIILVWPRGARGAVSLRRFDSHAALRAAPGPLLTQVTIAGVGSSDVGAAAFARTAADVTGAPVGAITAGYGVADLLSEAMGGWFVLGGANRVMQMYRDAVESDAPAPPAPAQAAGEPHRESAMLTRLMLDEDRRIGWIGGHSRGCASIARSLRALTRAGHAAAVARNADMRITTVGGVTALPPPFVNAGQYLGELDWFGGMNSQRDLDYATVPGAWHHLNTSMPGYLDFAAVLEREPLARALPPAV